MQSQISKIVLSVIITAAVVGGGIYYWQANITTQQPPQKTLLNFSSEKYAVQYPPIYSLEKNFGVTSQANDPIKMLTIKKDGGKLEIFQMKDFGDRPYGFEPEEGQIASQKDIDGYVPKEFLSVGTGDKKYDIWLYYSTDDSQTINELKTIFDSFVIK